MKAQAFVLGILLLLAGGFFVLHKPERRVAHRPSLSAYLEAGNAAEVLPEPESSSDIAPRVSASLSSALRAPHSSDVGVPESEELSSSLRTLLNNFLRLYEEGGEPEQFAEMEEAIEAELETVTPRNCARYLSESRTPILTHLLLRWIDRGLRVDRETWEETLARAAEECGEDPERLADLNEYILDRVQDPSRRARLSLAVLDRADRPRLLLQAARFAEGEAVLQVRDVLWARVPDDSAVEALGYVITPEETGRLIIAGDRPAVLNALEIAWHRTGHEVFRASLDRLVE